MPDTTNGNGNGKKTLFSLTPQQIIQYAAWFIILISAWFIMQNRVQNNESRSSENKTELQKIKDKQQQLDVEVAKMNQLLQTIKEDVKDIKAAVANDHY